MNSYQQKNVSKRSLNIIGVALEPPPPTCGLFGSIEKHFALFSIQLCRIFKNPFSIRQWNAALHLSKNYT